jgi:hypothetical protein
MAFEAAVHRHRACDEVEGEIGHAELRLHAVVPLEDAPRAVPVVVPEFDVSQNWVGDVRLFTIACDLEAGSTGPPSTTKSNGDDIEPKGNSLPPRRAFTLLSG